MKGKLLADGSRFRENWNKGDLDNNGDGGNPPDMEARIVRLETLAEVTEKRLVAIESDTKEIRKEISSAKIWALLLMGAGWLSLVGIMAKGFGWLK